jgi:hypothetical protein
MKQAALGLLIYAADHDDRLPPRFLTNQDLADAALPNTDHLEAVVTRNPNGGEVLPNRNLEGLHLSSVLDPPQTALLYETEEWPDDGGQIFGFVDGHVRRMRDPGQVNLDPSPGTSVAPFPQMSDLEEAMSFRITVGDTAYLLSWVKTRTYEVTIEKDNGEWQSVYTGTTMAMPILRRGKDDFKVYLVQPWFQIGKPEPQRGQSYYAVVTVTEDKVTTKLVLQATLR